MRHTQFYQLGGINSQSHSGLSILTFSKIHRRQFDDYLVVLNSCPYGSLVLVCRPPGNSPIRASLASEPDTTSLASAARKRFFIRSTSIADQVFNRFLPIPTFIMSWMVSTSKTN